VNNTDVEANKPKLDINCKIGLVDLNVVPGSTKIQIQKHVVLGEITFTMYIYMLELYFLNI